MLVGGKKPMNARNNRMAELLNELNICTKSSIDHFHSEIRDRDDICLVVSKRFGVIFPSSSDHIDT